MTQRSAFCLLLLSLSACPSLPASAVAFDGGSSLHIWITISSLANRDPNNAKSLLFRQVELNWINAPLEEPGDYLGLYLDGEPDGNSLPVSVHKLNGLSSGQIITDYYLPQIDFYNQSLAPAAEQHGRRRREWHSSGQYQPQLGQAPQSVGRAGDDKAEVLVAECIGYCLAYHSRSKILAKNCLKTNPQWMWDSFRSIGSRSLPTLMLPGTHNSATYAKQLDRSVLQMINKYQMNQDESIFNQLVYGIRHLDLRVGYSRVKQRAERLWIYHDIFRTELSLEEVFEQVRRFLELTSHEIVVMDFHRFTVGFQNENAPTQRERHAKFTELLLRHLGQYIVPSYLGQHAPLQEYVALGRRLLVGYASRPSLPGEQQASIAGRPPPQQQQVRDIDAPKQDHEDSLASQRAESWHQPDTRVGTRLYNKLKSLKLVSNSFSRRDERKSARLAAGQDEQPADQELNDSLIANAGLFFPPIRHLWPNRDTVEGLWQYLNESTCRRYFGELRSLMVELTPTVFGAISDKYDGNRRLAQLVNRQVTDWIRDRWLHCVNIVASDYFLGNDLIRLSIYANEMRASNRRLDLNAYGQCRSFRRVEHLLDKSKIPIQFAHQSAAPPSSGSAEQGAELELITHTSSDGNRILLRPLSSGQHSHNWSSAREKRDSFVDNVADGFSDIFSSFKRLLNI